MLASVAALFVAIVSAPPESASQRVQWSAPSECPGEAEVKARIDRMLAEGGSGRRENVRLRLVVERAGESFRLTAELVDGDAHAGQRVVEGVRCDDLAEAAVLIAAIAIDPDLVPPEPVEPPSDAVPQPGDRVPEPPQVELVPTEPAPVETVEPAPSDLERARVLEPIATARPRSDAIVPPIVTPIVTVDLGLGVGRLAAPVPMAMGRAGAGVEIGAFRGLARVSGFGPSRGEIEGAVAGGLFGAVAGGIAGCGRTPGSRWTFVGCLATDLGLAFGRGENTTNTRRARSLWWGIEAEAGVELALGPRIALALRGDGGVMPVRTDFAVDGQGRACCVQWGAGLRLGVLGRFGRVPQR